MMRHHGVVLLLLALVGLAGCRSRVLFIASTDSDQTTTKEALYAFRMRLDESRKHDTNVDVYEMKWHERTSPVLRSRAHSPARLPLAAS